MSGGAVTTGNNQHVGVAVEREADFRSWLLLLMSLTATITYTAGLTPPGGVWSADDKANGYVAGNPVLRDKFPRKYWAFYYSNTTAFVLSLMVMAMLAKQDKSKLQRRIFSVSIALCFLSLYFSYAAGSAVDAKSLVLSVFLIAIAMPVVVLFHVVKNLNSITSFWK